MYDILEKYIATHPGVQPRDIIKFCYQSLLGPGHMAPERGRAAAFAAEELEKAGSRRSSFWRAGRPGSTSTAAFPHEAWPHYSA